MKIPDRCLSCSHYGINSDCRPFNKWVFALLFSHKCDVYFPENSWLIALFEEINTALDHSCSNMFYDIFLFLSGVILFIPICCYLACIGSITRKTLFLCAVQKSYNFEDIKR